MGRKNSIEKDNFIGTFFANNYDTCCCGASLRTGLTILAVLGLLSAGLQVLKALLLGNPMQIILAVPWFVYDVLLLWAVSSRKKDLLMGLTAWQAVGMCCYILGTIGVFLYIVYTTLKPNRDTNTNNASTGMSAPLDDKPYVAILIAFLLIGVASVIGYLIIAWFGSLMYSLAAVFSVGGTGDEGLSARDIVKKMGVPFGKKGKKNQHQAYYAYGATGEAPVHVPAPVADGTTSATVAAPESEAAHAV